MTTPRSSGALLHLARGNGKQSEQMLLTGVIPTMDSCTSHLGPPSQWNYGVFFDGQKTPDL